MIKRFLDIFFSAAGLIATSPILIPTIALIWFHDFRSPFYIANRVGRQRRMFRMAKLRSMTVGADKAGIDSTSANDQRITKVGKFVRKFKLDELSQLWNVLIGDMSLVGPRPNVERGVAVYTDLELGLLSVRPGVTDISSIVFSDEGDILKDSADPDLDYDRLIRPWKSRLGLLYIENQSLVLDLKLIFLTALAIVNKDKALRGIQQILESLGADAQLREVCKRDAPLFSIPPPGANLDLASAQNS